MFGYPTGSLVTLALCSILCLNGIEGTHLRFPGPARSKSLPLILQRQEQAPYPPAGLVPDPPFELPTEEAVEFPQPDVIYGPPADTYGPPAVVEQPAEAYGPPAVVEQPAEAYGPPDLVYGPPEQTYGPPEQSANDDTSSSSPQSAAIIDLASLPLPPQAQYVLPLLNRLAAFRPQRPVLLTPQRRPAKLSSRPRPNPAKIVNSIKKAPVFPATPLALPFVDRRIPFRPQPSRLIVNAPFRRPSRH
ncbi:pollen-specific leucine-rich repeat extensin-like protein 3 [Drosophila ficusphila]|uniref:pollen-specific leucine-rich repeat extensin-like protein 3 n=1 Tax=Drosophila ficusphila TaxID=30025 RepID=UPI0007E7567B|nr:pollen-specific leucine-rich repeat extensin-like protein 3 [Drosophila ficusphila]